MDYRQYNERAMQAGKFRRSRSDIPAYPGKESIVERLNGKVMWFSPEKGFGFIECNDTPTGRAEVFVEQASIQSEGFRKLEKGQEVEFDLATDERGYFAKKVKVL